MYCIKCGVKLADTEKKCPLCDTAVCHPDIKQADSEPIYPKNKMPKTSSGYKALNGAIIILFLIPLFVCFFADISIDGVLEWSGYVAGALIFSYVTFALPLWFTRPNPVIFVPCSFAALELYLLYISLATDGGWFLSFAFPVVGGICIIVTTVVTLMRYVRHGRLYIMGGAFVASGAFMLLIEYLMCFTFGMSLIGWSIYPLAVFVLFGALLFYFAINSSAREMMERMLFF